MKLIGIFCFFLILLHTQLFGQLPSNTSKLVGTWKYKGGSGYEVWGIDDDVMHGVAYRLNKIGDTSRVEEINIRRVNKQLVYTLQTNRIIGDSVVAIKNVFISRKRKMEFQNIEPNMPFMISYKICFLNKKKLKINIQRDEEDEPITLILNKVKD